MASIGARQNADGSATYRVQFRISGRMVQESFAEERGALEFSRLVDRVGGDAARKVLRSRESKNRKVVTFRDYAARYLDPDSGLLTGVEPGTRRSYDAILRLSLLPFFGDYPIDAIDKADVGKWLAWQEQQPSSRYPGRTVAAKTIRNYHALLSAILRSAANEKLREDNPAHRTRLTGGTSREGVFLTRDEFASILHFAPHRYQPLFLFLAGTGCRWGEATAITWGNLDLDASPPTVRIEKAWKKGPTGAPILKQPKSKKGRRTISLTPDIIAALGDPGPADELVFKGPISGNHLWYNKVRVWAWDPAVKKAQNRELCEANGLVVLTKKPTLHDLRHSHASWLISRGVPLPYIQARLGHEKITTTVDTYGHLVPDAHQQMADVVAQTLENVRPLKQMHLRAVDPA